MSLDSALLTRVRLLAAAVETTTGTAATLAGTNAAMNVYDLKLTLDVPTTERQGQASLSNLPPIPGAESGKITFKTEVFNAATPPMWLSTLLLGCGWALNTGVYSPSSSSQTTLTLGMYQQGSRLRTLVGCVGTFKITGEAGKPMTIEWEFTGKLGGATSTAFLSPTFPSTVPPRFAGATLTVGSNAYKCSKFEFDMGNTVVGREDVTDPTGWHSFTITQRKPTVKIDPEAVAYATHNWVSDFLASTSAALSLAVGSGTNGIITVAAPAMQLLNPPNDGDRNGILTDELEFLCTPSPFGSSDTEASITPS